MDGIEDLKVEKTFLLETTGKERNTRENRASDSSQSNKEAGKVYIIPTL